MFAALIVGVTLATVQVVVKSSPHISATKLNSHYPNQAGLLAPSPLQKLPVGAVRAKGWLLTELQLQRDGFSGNLTEISKFLDVKNNAWMGNQNSNRAGWEELPYWLRGQIALGYVLDDPKIIAQTKQWVEGVLASQKPDGWFGPESNLKTQNGTPDLWPNMLMQSVLQTYYEATNDQRVIKLMSHYVDWLSALPDGSLLDPRPYWQYYRAGDQMASLIWLYERTHDPKIVAVAKRLHNGSAKWVNGVVNVHGVNFAQGFREPAAYSVFSKSESDWKATERDLKTFRDEYGQMPGGMYGADENARKGFTDPRQAAETCAVVEMMYSHELLLEMSGDAKWADEAEDAAFNWLPATMTADLRALRYLTCGNMAVSDQPSKSPGVENGGPMFLMDPHDHRCCQHNVGMGWPFFTERLFLATNDNGLLAAIYAPSEVTAKVGENATVSVTEETDYPFDSRITFRFEPSHDVSFPFFVRVPQWCDNPKLTINGQAHKTDAQPGAYLKIDRRWKKGDVVILDLPMKVETRTWSERPGTVSVSRGPLSYSLKIDEETERVGRTDKWPSLEILPKSPWNYGLVTNTGFKVTKRKLKPGVQAFDLDNVPVTLEATGQQLPEWTTDMYGLVAPLQKSPAFSDQKVEQLTLVPMGAARLRITVFPTVSNSPDATVWQKPLQARKPIPATYSFRSWWDSESALSDGLLPGSSDDEMIPRFTWWDHKGTSEWVQYTFKDVRTFQKTKVYWYDDGAKGGCRMPASWKIQVKVSGEWKDVETDSPYPIVKDGWSEMSFKPIGGTEIRLVAQLQTGWSAGILEWEVN